MVDQVRSIYTLTGHTNPTDLLTLADGQAVFASTAAPGDDIRGASQGATFDNATDDHVGVIADVALSKSLAGNTGGGGFYKGGPSVVLPAGKTAYMAANTVNINHALRLVGKGSGRFGPGARGVSALRYSAGAVGIIVQGPGTSGTTTVDGITHDGSGGAILEHFMMQGPEDGVEDPNDIAIVARKQITGNDVYIRGFRGPGVQAWAGAYASGANYGGDVSLCAFYGWKVEASLSGFSIRGGDGNIGLLVNCESYQCFQTGFEFDTGAGPTIGIGLHTASNGMVSGHLSYMCHYLGRRFAATWGKTITELTTNAPPASATSNAYWNYIEDGTADTVVKTWDGVQQFRMGGDVITAGPYNPNQIALFLGIYSENPGVSQFGPATLLVNSLIAKKYRIGGVHIYANNGVFNCDESVNFGGNLTAHGTTHIFGDSAASGSNDTNVYFDSTSGTTGFWFRTTGSLICGYVLSENGNGNYYLAPATNGHVFQTGAFGAAVTRASVTTNGLELPASHGLYVNSTKVVGARQTGTAANATDLATALTLVNDLKAKLIAHGLIS